MEKEMSITEARENLSGIVEQVQYRGVTYVISRHGKPAAVMVPLEVYASWKQQRQEFFRTIREVQERAALDSGEAEELGSEAINAARTEE